MSPARRAHSSKPAAAACGGRVGQIDRRTDGRTDARLLHKPCSAYHSGSANSCILLQHLVRHWTLLRFQNVLFLANAFITSSLFSLQSELE